MAADPRQLRLARAQALFREVNDRIAETAARLGPMDDPYEFLCECGDDRCLRRVRLSLAEYEEARADGATSLIAAEHSGG
jgi:hypothetical protein